MTVKDLKEALENMPDHLDVFIQGSDPYDLTSVEDIRHANNGCIGSYAQVVTE